MIDFLQNRLAVIILILAVGSVSIVGIGMTHVAMADQVGKLCLFFACGNANITGGILGPLTGGFGCNPLDPRGC